MARSRREWATWMAAKGINVFIVDPRSKRPLGGVSWYDHQSTNAEQINEWFDYHEDCNYGLHLGSEYVVIDLDLKKGTSVNGIQEFETICAEHGIDDFQTELNTLMVKTPSKGYHLYFRAPFPCANRNTFPNGIDVRGTIGFVVGPGSYYDGKPDGKNYEGPYELINPEADIQPLPEFLHEYIVRPSERDPNSDIPVVELDLPSSKDAAYEWLRNAEPAREGYNGDDHTYSTLQNLRDFGLSEEGMFVALHESGWNARCQPPWEDGELDFKIRNAWLYGQNRPGIKSPEYQVQRLNRARRSRVNATGQTNQQSEGSLALNLVVDNANHEDQSVRPANQNVPDLDLASDENLPALNEDEDDGPLSAMELAQGEFPRAEHLWQDFLLKDHPNSIDGDGGVGKTQVLIQIAAAVAAGKPLFGHETTQQPVLLVLCEDTYGETKHRLVSACEDLGVDLADLPIEIWCRPGVDSVLAVVDDNGVWKRGEFYDFLVDQLKEIGPCFLGLDTISDIAVLDENKRLPMNTLAKKVLGGLCNKCETTILITRHPSKASMNDGTYYSGSTAGNAAFRNRLLLAEKDKGGARTLGVVKSNYGLTGEAELSHTGSVFQNRDTVERVEIEKFERQAVLQTVTSLRAKGITLVKSNGNGQKPRDIAKLLKSDYSIEITWQDVRDHLSALEQSEKIHWVSAKGGNNGWPATYNIGPRPDELKP